MSVFLWDQATKDICLYLFKDKYKVQIEDKTTDNLTASVGISSRQVLLVNMINWLSGIVTSSVKAELSQTFSDYFCLW